jgi:hypothetical protein
MQALETNPSSLTHLTPEANLLNELIRLLSGELKAVNCDDVAKSLSLFRNLMKFREANICFIEQAAKVISEILQKYHQNDPTKRANELLLQFLRSASLQDLRHGLTPADVIASWGLVSEEIIALVESQNSKAQEETSSESFHEFFSGFPIEQFARLLYLTAQMRDFDQGHHDQIICQQLRIFEALMQLKILKNRQQVCEALEMVWITLSNYASADRLAAGQRDGNTVVNRDTFLDFCLERRIFLANPLLLSSYPLTEIVHRLNYKLSGLSSSHGQVNESQGDLTHLLNEGGDLGRDAARLSVFEYVATLLFQSYLAFCVRVLFENGNGLSTTSLDPAGEWVKKVATPVFRCPSTQREQLLHEILRMNPEGPLFDERTLIKANMGFGEVLTVENFRKILKINSLGSLKA